MTMISTSLDDWLAKDASRHKSNKHHLHAFADPHCVAHPDFERQKGLNVFQPCVSDLFEPLARTFDAQRVVGRHGRRDGSERTWDACTVGMIGEDVCVGVPGNVFLCLLVLPVGMNRLEECHACHGR